MQLNKFTDYALRILMYVAQPRETLYTIAELAENLQVSENHTMKIVHFMAKQQWIITTRGKGGGIKFKPETAQLSLGAIIRILQGNQAVVECHNPPCILRSNCGLKGILAQALEAFYTHLDQYLLSDVLSQTSLSPSTQSPIPVLHLF